MHVKKHGLFDEAAKFGWLGEHFPVLLQVRNHASPPPQPLAEFPRLSTIPAQFLAIDVPLVADKLHELRPDLVLLVHAAVERILLPLAQEPGLQKLN